MASSIHSPSQRVGSRQSAMTDHPSNPMTNKLFLATSLSVLATTMKGALLAAVAFSLALPAMASNQEALKAGDWDFINSATDGTSYFGQVQTQLGDQIVLKVRVKGDQSIENKDYVIQTSRRPMGTTNG